MLKLSAVSYEFPDNLAHALDDVSLDFEPGRIHALLGENGAGKSTLARIASGHLRPVRGTIELDGNVLHFDSPASAIRAGIAIVSQDPKLAAELSVEENLRLSGEPTAGAIELLELGQVLHVKAGSLSASARQRLATARAILKRPKYLFLDEVTAAYSKAEQKTHYAMLRRLRDEGMAIIVVTHKLQELEEGFDTIHVLKKGRVSATGLAARDVGRNEILSLMFSRRAAKPVSPAKRFAPRGHIILKDSVSTHLVETDGRIVGIAGLKNEGIELLESAFLHRAGELQVDFRPGDTASRVIKALVPERRFRNGVAVGLSILDCLQVRSRKSIFPKGFLSKRRQREFASAFALPPSSRPSDKIETLSGGTIQRLIVDRESTRPRPDFLVCFQPSWGLDAERQAEMAETLRGLAAEGCAVLICASDSDEVWELCDTIFVMRGKRFLGPWERSEISQQRLQAELVGETRET